MTIHTQLNVYFKSYLGTIFIGKHDPIIIDVAKRQYLSIQDRNENEVTETFLDLIAHDDLNTDLIDYVEFNQQY